MAISTQSAIAFVKKFEAPGGVPQLQPYKDATGYSIGYGHFIFPGEEYLMQGITAAKAESLLQGDIDKVIDTINSKVKVPLNQNQVDALVSLILNIGAGAFGTSKLLKLINSGASYSDISDRWDDVYITSVGVFLPGLLMRRRAEASLFTGSEAPGTYSASVSPAGDFSGLLILGLLAVGMFIFPVKK